MGNYKGTGIVFLRSLLQKNGVEGKFYAGLTPEERDVFAKTMNVSWIPIGLTDRFYSSGAALLYPDRSEREALQAFGAALAKDNIGGIYKIIVKIISLEYFLKQAARLWRTYHDTGDTRIEKVSEQNFYFIVDNYPDLPERFAESTDGYILGMGEMAGLRNVQVAHEATPSGIRWRVMHSTQQSAD